MAEPEGGWLHDDRGLAAGMGVFFSFPVKVSPAGGPAGGHLFANNKWCLLG
jgi:hypothetical protein